MKEQPSTIPTQEVPKKKTVNKAVIIIIFLISFLFVLLITCFIVLVSSKSEKQMKKSLEQVTAEYPDFNVIEKSQSTGGYNPNLNTYNFSLTHKRYENVKLSISADYSDTSSSFTPDENSRGGTNSLDQIFNTRINTGNYANNFKESFARFINDKPVPDTTNLKFSKFEDMKWNEKIMDSYAYELEKVSKDFNNDWSSLFMIYYNDTIVSHNKKDDSWNVVYRGKIY